MTAEATAVYKKFGKTDVLMLLAILFWAVNFSFLKIVFREMEPLAFNGLRMLLASLLLVLFCLFSGESLRVDRKDFWKLVGLGVIGNTCRVCYGDIRYGATKLSHNLRQLCKCACNPVRGEIQRH